MSRQAAAPARADWEALGTSVVLCVTDSAALAPARAIVARELDEIDLACSRFRDDSELTRVNAASGRTVRVGAAFVAALQVALRAAELTDGDVDPTVGAALELAGYDRDWRALTPPPRDAPPAHGSAALSPAREAPRRLCLHARARAGWQAIELDAQHGTVRVAPGMRIDLGATAKAWAADRAAHAVYAATGSGVLVSLGGDLATCGEAPPGGWSVRVTDDHRSGPDAPGQTVSIRDGAIATSSTAVRRWRHDGRVAHHIIDPATQAPVRAGAWRTVSVAAASCVDANIASTAALVRGRAAAPWLARLALPARLVDERGRVHTLGGWPHEPWQTAQWVHAV